MKKLIFILFVNVTTIAVAQKINHWETVIFANDTWKYFIGNAEPNPFWRANTYDDFQWLSGKGGFGYGDGDDTTVIVPCYSVFLRKVFTVTDTARISSAILNLDFDDGFVAYINGIEIARSGIEGTYPAYNIGAVDHEAKLYTGGTIDYFPISKSVLRRCLINGENVLSIQVHNSNLGSSDLTAIPYFSVSIIDDKKYYKPTPSWFVTPPQEGGFESNLPIVSVLTNGMNIQDNGRKINVLMRVISNSAKLNRLTDSANNYFGYAGMEIRGATSSGYPQKSFNVETRDEQEISRNVSLLGMPEENDWALIGSYNDKSLVRNSFSYSVFTALGHYAPRTRYCELFINGDYQGIYLLTEKIKRDKNRVPISNFDNKVSTGDAITGGYIFKNDNRDADETSFLSNYSERGIAGVQEVPIIYVYPKSNELSNAHKKYFPDFITSFENVLYSNTFSHPANGYRKYINVSSFIDYFILSEISRSVDAYKKSKFFYKDVDSKGGLIHSGPPWDYDWAYKNIPEGNNQFECFYGNRDGSGWAYKVYLCNHSPKFLGWTARLMQDPNFVNELKSRYVALRKNVLKTENLNLMIDSLRNIISEAQSRHFQKWDILGRQTTGSPEVDAQPTTYNNAISQLKNWLDIRLQWLDRNMPGTVTSIKISHPISAKIFPNPTSDKIFIESGHRIARVQLLNAIGQIKLDKKVSASSLYVSCQGLEKGIYYCKIFLENVSPFTSKLMIN